MNDLGVKPKTQIVLKIRPWHKIYLFTADYAGDLMKGVNLSTCQLKFASMPNFFKIFWWGLLISFLGSLPLGTLNIAAMQLGIYEGVKYALLFSLGSLLVEMIYVRISLVGIDWVRKQEKLMHWLEWITFGIVVALAVVNFIAAVKTQQQPGAAVNNPYAGINVNRFLLGAGMCAVNPVQIPFWFGWSTVLFSKGILKPVKSQYNIYIIGIGLGTLLGNAVFIFGGKLLVQKIRNSEAYLNWFIGAIFAVTAIIQLIKIFRNKNVEKFRELDNEAIEQLKSAED